MSLLRNESTKSTVHQRRAPAVQDEDPEDDENKVVCNVRKLVVKQVDIGIVNCY